MSMEICVVSESTAGSIVAHQRVRRNREADYMSRLSTIARLRARTQPHRDTVRVVDPVEEELERAVRLCPERDLGTEQKDASPAERRVDHGCSAARSRGPRQRHGRARTMSHRTV